MAMACKQLLGWGAQEGTRNLGLIPKPFVLRSTARLGGSLNFAISAAAGSLSSDNAGSNSDKQKPPTRIRNRGQIPPSWKDLSTPVPEPPNYLLLAAGFSLIYLTRQAVAAELIEWASIVAIIGLTIIRSTQRLAIFLLRKALHFVKIPMAFGMTLAGWSGLLARDFYVFIVNTTSIWPTSEALLLVTLVLSVGEATQATSVNGQLWAFALASAFGVGAVWGVIHHFIFVLLLLLLTGFSLLVQKKDAVSAILPATVMLVAIAERPLKAVAFVLYLALAVYTHWNAPKDQLESPASSSMQTVQPLIMVAAAIFVGLTAGSRYLRMWQILWLAKG